MPEFEKKNRLEQARAANKPQNLSRNLSKKKPSSGSDSLINPFLDWLFGVAFAVALLKDFLDFAILGSIPLIGTVITILASLTIGAVLIITGASSNGKSIVKKFGVLLGGSTLEMFFGLNFLPMETITLIITIYLTLAERKAASKANEQPSYVANVQSTAPRNVSYLNSAKKRNITNSHEETSNDWDYADAA